MYVIATDDYEALSRAAADVVSSVITSNPHAVILLPTGNSPLGLYRELGRRRERGEITTAHLRIVQLDEYLGVADDDRRSLYRWLANAALTPLGIAAERVVRLPGDARDLGATCRAFDAQVDALGGIDLSVLGIGRNGHLGFNEPPSGPDEPTRAVSLTEESLTSNAEYWGGRAQVPPRALTAGMRTLLASRHTLLLASGAQKRDILRRAAHGPLTPEVPASYLQRAPDVTVLADRAAWPDAPTP